MKASVIALLFAAGLVAAQDFTGQPECAIPCLEDAIPKAGCAIEDTACACKPDVQAKLVGLVGPCLLSKCSSGDVAKAQAAAADACKRNAGGSTQTSSDATATEPASETTTSAAETTTEAGTTTDAGTTTSEATTAPASTTAVETTASETTTAAETSTGASTGPTIQPSAPSGVSNSTVSGTRSVITRTSTAFVGGDGGSRTSGIPASTTLAGSDATAPVAGVLGAVLAALVAL
ncbi:cell wall protein [Trichoderma gracile]